MTGVDLSCRGGPTRNYKMLDSDDFSASICHVEVAPRPSVEMIYLSPTPDLHAHTHPVEYSDARTLCLWDATHQSMAIPKPSSPICVTHIIPHGDISLDLAGTGASVSQLACGASSMISPPTYYMISLAMLVTFLMRRDRASLRF